MKASPSASLRTVTVVGSTVWSFGETYTSGPTPRVYAAQSIRSGENGSIRPARRSVSVSPLQNDPVVMSDSPSAFYGYCLRHTASERRWRR